MRNLVYDQHKPKYPVWEVLRRLRRFIDSCTNDTALGQRAKEELCEDYEKLVMWCQNDFRPEHPYVRGSPGPVLSMMSREIEFELSDRHSREHEYATEFLVGIWPNTGIEMMVPPVDPDTRALRSWVSSIAGLSDDARTALDMFGQQTEQDLVSICTAVSEAMDASRSTAHHMRQLSLLTNSSRCSTGGAGRTTCCEYHSAHVTADAACETAAKAHQKLYQTADTSVLSGCVTSRATGASYYGLIPPGMRTYLRKVAGRPQEYIRITCNEAEKAESTKTLWDNAYELWGTSRPAGSDSQ